MGGYLGIYRLGSPLFFSFFYIIINTVLQLSIFRLSSPLNVSVTFNLCALVFSLLCSVRYKGGLARYEVSTNFVPCHDGDAISPHPRVYAWQG